MELNQNLNSSASSSATEASGFGWYLLVLKKYAEFNGRARRKEYWMFVLFSMLIAIAIGFVSGILGLGQWLSNIYSLAVLVPSIAAGVRRLHDSNRSGWWLLLPIVNLVFLCQDSDPQTNRFGPCPKSMI